MRPSRILLKKGESVTFNVKFALSRWDLFIAMLDPQFKGFIYTEKRFEIANIMMIREGVPEVEIEHDETQ